jgi:hypothetical protein
MEHRGRDTACPIVDVHAAIAAHCLCRTRSSIEHVKGLKEAGVFNDAEIMEIERGNALKLLPRLAA